MSATISGVRGARRKTIGAVLWMLRWDLLAVLVVKFCAVITADLLKVDTLIEFKRTDRRFAEKG